MHKNIVVGGGGKEAERHRERQRERESDIYSPFFSHRIIVSAPKGTAPGAQVPRTGLVYSCPVNPGICSPLPGKLFDTSGKKYY